MTDALEPAVTIDSLTARLERFAAQVRQHDARGAVITPGAGLRYLLGHSVASHERLTCLVVPHTGAPCLVVPALERLGWDGSPVDRLGLEIVTWTDGSDPYALVAGKLGDGGRALAVSNDMPAHHALHLGEAVSDCTLTLAGGMLAELRMRKDPGEIAALHAVGAAIDRVHRAIGQWLIPGRTERDVAADIAAAIVAEGHARADFVIVGSGPHGASPHHEASDRVIGHGEPVVIDIGGPAPSGYNSDSTRTYITGGGEVDPEVRRVYDAVRAAQAAGVAAARPGVTAASVDAASRAVIEQAGYGDYFITRTGHGIGLEVHEHPYIVAGNDQILEEGMAFSVEPGIYLPGRFGVRIEDIIVVTADGAELCNTAPTAWTVLD